MAPASSAAPDSAPADSTATAAGPFVQVAESEEFGPILVDASCRTLYVFTNDTPGTSACVEGCAEAWPPLTVPDGVVPPLADELDPALFTVIEHSEAGPMLQVGDWPLYYFASDAAPGDINGQAVGGVWWVVAPDGVMIESEAGAGAPAGTDAGAAASMPAGTEAMGSDGY
jgi:predicted lipoprotein with Yx(FWY)xxD motif